MPNASSGAKIHEDCKPRFVELKSKRMHRFINYKLELERHGLNLLPRSPSLLTPCLDGRYLFLHPDTEMNRSEIGKFSKKDAEAYPRYEERLEKFCKLMDFVIDSPLLELRQLYHASMVDRMKDKVDKFVFCNKLLGM